MNVKKLLVIGVVAVFSVVIFSQTVSAMGFDGTEKIERLQLMLQKYQKVQDALDKGDFNLWKEAVTSNNTNPKILEKINEQNFPTFVEAHKLVKEGKKDEAQKLFQSLGVDKLEKNNGSQCKKGNCGKGCGCGCGGNCASGGCGALK